MKTAITFFVCLLSCAALAWLSGYDFDHRGPFVAMFVAFSIWASVAIACTLSYRPVKKRHENQDESSND